MIHDKCYRMAKRFIDSGGHHDWLSRDYLDMDCQAIGCISNVNKKCMTPSACKIQADGKCAGFQAKPLPPKSNSD